MTSESYVLDPLGRSALADLEERKLLTHGEARSVLEKRERLELNLSETQPTRAAYARAIAYEEKCDALLSVRRAKKVSIKRGPGDHFQSRRIAALYERALSRFGDDSKLWLDYVSYLKKTNQPKAVGRVLARACRANATSLEPWLAAARWELKDRGNATAARRLLQRALRFNGEKHELWSHYIAFELSYVERLRKRSAALGTPSPEVELTEVAVEAARAAFGAVAVEDRVELLTSIEKACASIGGHAGAAVAEAARAAAGGAPPSLPPPLAWLSATVTLLNVAFTAAPKAMRPPMATPLGTDNALLLMVEFTTLTQGTSIADQGFVVFTSTKEDAAEVVVGLAECGGPRISPEDQRSFEQ